MLLPDGYCPAVVEGDFIKAKTLLFPGYASTPEYGAILRAPLSADRRDDMISSSRNLDAQQICESGEFSLIKWFHEHGVQQVIQTKRELFR